jgi:hypothetical protein
MSVEEGMRKWSLKCQDFSSYACIGLSIKQILAKSLSRGYAEYLPVAYRGYRAEVRASVCNNNNNNNNNVYFPQTDKQTIEFIHKPKLFTITYAKKIYDITYQ